MTEDIIFRFQLSITLIVFPLLILFVSLLLVLQPVFATSEADDELGEKFELTVRIIDVGYPYPMPGYIVTKGVTSWGVSGYDFEDDDKAKIKIPLYKYELYYPTDTVCIADDITMRPICQYFYTDGNEAVVNFYVH